MKSRKSSQLLIRNKRFNFLRAEKFNVTYIGKPAGKETKYFWFFKIRMCFNIFNKQKI